MTALTLEYVKRLRQTIREQLDPSLQVFMVRDYQEVKDAGLHDLAWTLSYGCHLHDAEGFFELLENYLEK